MKELNYTQLKTDQCVYAKRPKWNLKNLQSDSHFVFVLIHSDDLIVISNVKSVMMKEKEILLTAFEGVDQGSLSSFVWCGNRNYRGKNHAIDEMLLDKNYEEIRNFRKHAKR